MEELRIELRQKLDIVTGRLTASGKLTHFIFTNSVAPTHSLKWLFLTSSNQKKTPKAFLQVEGGLNKFLNKDWYFFPNTIFDEGFIEFD